jgi:crossover junction endodeoxyribonuclease RusA
VGATITIPMLPDRELSPNSRAHWSVKQRAAREFRGTAAWATIAWLTHEITDVDWGRGAVMDVEIQWCCGRKKMDDDNAWASLKAARDGIADVLFGGEDRFITQGTLTQTRGDGSILVTLREVAGDG